LAALPKLHSEGFLFSTTRPKSADSKGCVSILSERIPQEIQAEFTDHLHRIGFLGLQDAAEASQDPARLFSIFRKAESTKHSQEALVFNAL